MPDKEELIVTSDHLAAAGIFVLAFAMTGAIFVAFELSRRWSEGVTTRA